MCNFLSALVLRNGDVLTHPMLDSHSDLVRYFKLPDTTAYITRFAKVELVPVDWADAATWTWRVDEAEPPMWLEEVAEKAEAALRARAAKMILKDGAHDLIVDGCWIVAGTATVRDVRAGRIVRVQDSATISGVRGSATISGVRGSATISDVRDSATISDVWDSAQLDDSAKKHQVTQ